MKSQSDAELPGSTVCFITELALEPGLDYLFVDEAARASLANPAPSGTAARFSYR